MSAPLIADRLAHRLEWKDLDPLAVAGLIHLARIEDLQGHGLSQPPAQTGDVTSAVIQSERPAVGINMVNLSSTSVHQPRHWMRVQRRSRLVGG